VRDSTGAKGWAPASYFQSHGNNSTPTNKQVSLSFNQLNGEEWNRNPSCIIYFHAVDAESVAEDDDFDDLYAAAADSLDFEECYVVVKDYAKQDVDELDVYVGQVVRVIDDTDPGRWHWG
jgi:hypothetical protein